MSGRQRSPGRIGWAWRRAGRRLAATGLAVAGALALVGVGATVLQAPGTGHPAHSAAPAPAASRPVMPGAVAVVMGDSTAAGDGLPPVSPGSPTDLACGRSADSYAQYLARTDHWHMVNLACNGATVTSGLLGSQIIHGRAVPPQLAAARLVRGTSVVIVSVGADDLDWATVVVNCAITAGCGDAAMTAQFGQRLASFRTSYQHLLSQLGGFPGHPRVVINQYYDPFGSQQACLDGVGLTPAKLSVLRSWLASLNGVLAAGAAASGFLSVKPDFTGHQLCTKRPYVQGLLDRAPLHPTAAGEAAIAQADQAALRS